MARAIARGWGGARPVLGLRVRAKGGCAGRRLGGRAATNLEVAEEADLVVLCHKPAEFEQVATEIKPHAKAVASVLGSISASSLRTMYEPTPTFRPECQHPGRGASGRDPVHACR